MSNELHNTLHSLKLGWVFPGGGWIIVILVGLVLGWAAMR